MAEQKVEYPIYDPNSGRCKACGAETLWGDAPHADGCMFAIMVKRLHVTIAKLEEITTTDTCCAYCGAAYPEGTPRFGGDALTEHIRVCSEHPMRQAEERIKELEGIVEVYEDKDFFDALAKTVMAELRRQRDECRARMARAHKLLVQDLAAVFPLAGEDVEQAKQAMLDAVKDYVEDL